MNNETKQKVTIKLRGDRVYDIYLGDAWVASRGSIENVLDEVRKLLNPIDKQEKV